MLRKVAQDIPVDYPNLKELIQNMFETNTASDGVGLAAPQIGKSIRVVIIDLDVLKEDFPEYEASATLSSTPTSWSMTRSRRRRPWRRAASPSPVSTSA